LSEPLLSIVLVNYNVEHFLELCLQSVFSALKDIPSEVWVVDNNSSDGSVEMVRKKFGSVHLIANSVNLGFSSANNQAIRKANGKYVLLLNPDTIVPEDCFQNCLRFMEKNPDAGALGARMYDGSGTYLPESKRGLPTPWVSFCKAFGLSRLFPNSPVFGKYHLSYLDENEVHEVDVLSGAFMFIRKEALDKAGLLDEDFFMYGEDVDLSYRIQQAGFTNYYFPEATIIHFKGESTKRGSISFVKHFYKAMLLFSRKHFSDKPAFTIFIYFGIAVRAILALLKRAFDFSASFLAEFTIAYAGMVFIKSWWELNFKGVPGMYPDFFIQLLIPTYLLVWIGSTRGIGRFSEEYGHGAILKGIALGTILISGVTNFFDDYRFSKGLILIGAVWTYLVITARFVLFRWLQNKNVLFTLTRKKRVLIAGFQEDFENAVQILKKFGDHILICGWASPEPEENPSEKWLGRLSDLDMLAFRLGLDEVLFCTGHLENKRIIGWVQDFRNSRVRFSFLASNGQSIVTSHDKHDRGTVFQTENIPDLLRPYNQRLKRLSDLIICFVLAPLLPLIFFRVRSFSRFLKNYGRVFTGKKTWISLEDNKFQGHGLQPGVITMEDLAGKGATEALVRSLESMYLHEFYPEHEIWTVLKNLKKLDS
jgi:GT2 family glycosyltransferase